MAMHASSTAALQQQVRQAYERLVMARHEENHAAICSTAEYLIVREVHLPRREASIVRQYYAGALLKLGRSSDALRQYHYAVELSAPNEGEVPPFAHISAMCNLAYALYWLRDWQEGLKVVKMIGHKLDTSSRPQQCVALFAQYQQEIRALLHPALL